MPAVDNTVDGGKYVKTECAQLNGHGGIFGLLGPATMGNEEKVDYTPHGSKKCRLGWEQPCDFAKGKLGFRCAFGNYCKGNRCVSV